MSGSLGCLTALHRAAAEARLRRAELWAVLARETPGGELGGRYPAHVSAVAQCRATAGDRLREALDPREAARPVQRGVLGTSPVLSGRAAFLGSLYGS